MTISEVTLHQILDARDRRAARQRALLDTYQPPLVCFTMNIAGPIKTSPLIERAFFDGLEVLQQKLPTNSIRHREVEIADTGCQAMLCVALDAERLKAICVAVEETSPVGRLFDMDVLNTEGVKVSRKGTRGCLVCGAEGRACAAGRLHTVAELQAVTHRILTEHFWETDHRRLAVLAVESLLDEVYTTPKPGLVDGRNNGSHTDMDVSTFVKSAEALQPYFAECLVIGHRICTLPPHETFPLLRKAGVAAEAAMYRATNGVNTHKGAIYSLGVVCGAVGRLWNAGQICFAPQERLPLCAEMTREAVQADLACIDDATAGGRLYRTHGLTGIRGEVAAGFPSIATVGLPVYRRLLQSGLSANDAGAITLVHLVATVQDTTLYHRGGVEGAAFAADAARQLIGGDVMPTVAQLERLDDEFIARRLSPGGCADLLAVTYFLHKITAE